MSYAIKMQCKEALDYRGDIMTPAGTWVWVCDGEWGETCRGADSGRVPDDVRIFETIGDAIEFTGEFKGHPWYYLPNGDWKIVEVLPKMVRVQAGWQEAKL